MPCCTGDRHLFRRRVGNRALHGRILFVLQNIPVAIEEVVYQKRGDPGERIARSAPGEGLARQGNEPSFLLLSE